MTNSRPPVVMIPGAGDNANVWAEVGALVEDVGVRWVAIDLPGRKDATDAHPGSIEGLADWVATRITALDLGPIVLVGHSMGSVTALEVAARYPALIDHLILMCTGAPMAVSEALLEPESDESLHQIVTRYSHVRDAGDRYPEAIARHLTEYENLHDGTFTADLRACHEYGGATEAARRVTVGTTVVLAEKDVMVTPDLADPIINGLRECDVVMLDGVGHAIADEAPAEAARIIAEVATAR